MILCVVQGPTYGYGQGSANTMKSPQPGNELALGFTAIKFILLHY